MSISNVLPSAPRKLVKARRPYAFEKAGSVPLPVESVPQAFLGKTVSDGIAAFLLSKADKAPKTQQFYKERSKPFETWCAAESITHCDHLTPGILDRYKAHRIGKSVSQDTLRSDLLTAVAIVKYDHSDHPDPNHRYKFYNYQIARRQQKAAPHGDRG